MDDELDVDNILSRCWYHSLGQFICLISNPENARLTRLSHYIKQITNKERAPTTI